MNNFDVIYFFLFVFFTLNILMNVFRFIRALLSNPPRKMVLDSKDLIFLGVSISYFLTYLIKL